MSEPKISKPVATITHIHTCIRCSLGALSAARYSAAKVRRPRTHCCHSAVIRLSANRRIGV
jgi:hypothetical protein